MNNQMLKKVIPFIAIFVLSLGVAVTTFIQENTRQAEAAVDGINIELTNQSASLDAKSNWSWRADLLAENHIGEKVDTESVVSWCRETFGKKGESEGRICNSDLTPAEFISVLKREKKSITIQNSNFEVVHPGVKCGRVYLEIYGLDGVLGTEVYDTGIECKDSDIPTPTLTGEPQYGLLDENGNELSFSELIKDIFSIFGSFNKNAETSPTEPSPGAGNNPLTPFPTTPPNDPGVACSGSSVVSWAGCISEKLELGIEHRFNKMLGNIANGGYTATKRSAQNEGTSPTGIYWCTNIVIDSYNLFYPGAGNNPSAAHQSVLNMRRFFASTSGYRYLDFRNVATRRDALEKTRAGDVLIMQSVFDRHTSQHVGIISSIEIDSHCNGKIRTLESNSARKDHAYVVRACDIINTSYPVVAIVGK